jgi:hypothetical protein
MRVCDGWGAKAGEYLFAEGRSAVAGILTPVFSDRHQTKERKKSKKEKKRTKRKEKIYYLYICFLKDKRIKEYIYILVCGETPVHGLVHTLQRDADSIGV